jgi:solute carrier family 35 protein F5
MFTFLVSLQFLGERFTWLKLASVSLCMAGTIIVSLGDSWKGESSTTSHPFWGDLICLLSAMFYAGYTALLRVKIPDEDDEKGKVSTALVFGYLGFFNAVLVAPIALLLYFTGLEPFHRLTWTQFGLILAKGTYRLKP